MEGTGSYFKNVWGPGTGNLCSPYETQGTKSTTKTSVPPALLQWKLCFLTCLLHLNYPVSLYHSAGCTHKTHPLLNSPALLWSLKGVWNIYYTHRWSLLQTQASFPLSFCIQAGQLTRIFAPRGVAGALLPSTTFLNSASDLSQHISAVVMCLLLPCVIL